MDDGLMLCHHTACPTLTLPPLTPPPPPFPSYSVETEGSRKAAAAASSGIVEEVKAPIGFIQAFLLPNVMNYAVAFGFFKLVRRGRPLLRI